MITKFRPSQRIWPSRCLLTKPPPVKAESTAVIVYWNSCDCLLKAHDIINEKGLPYTPRRRILLHKLITALMHAQPGLHGSMQQIPAPHGEDASWDYPAVKKTLSKLMGLTQLDT